MGTTTFAIATTTLQQLNQEMHDLMFKSNINDAYFSNTLLIFTTIIVVIIAIFLTLQFLYARHMEKSQLTNLKNEIKDFINTSLAKKEAELTLAMDSRNEATTKLLKDEINLQGKSNESEISRLLALASENLKAYEAAALNWLTSAHKRFLLGAEKEKTGQFLSFATQNVEQITDPRDLDEDIDQIKRMLADLEPGFKSEVRAFNTALEKKLSETKPALNNGVPPPISN